MQELAQPAVRGGQTLCGQGRRVDFNGRSLKGCLPIAEKPCCTRQGSGRRRCARAGDQRSAGTAGKRGFCCLADFGARLAAEVSRLQNHHLGRHVHNGRGSLEGAAHGRQPGSACACIRATAQAKRSSQAAELRIGACCACHQLKAQDCANGSNLALVALCPGFQAVENHIEVQAVHKARNEVCANGCAVVNGSGGVNAQQCQESGSNAAAKASAQACGPVGEELAAAAVPPLVERLRHNLVPGNAQLAPNVGVRPLVARGKLRNGLAQVLDLCVHMVHCVADCIFHQRHFAGDPGCKFTEVRGKALAQGDFCAVNRRLQQRKAAVHVVQHRVCHLLGCTVGVVHGCGQFVVIIFGSVDDCQHTGHGFLAEDGTCGRGLFGFRKAAKAAAQVVQNLVQGPHFAVALGQADAVLVHGALHLVGGSRKVCKGGFQAGASHGAFDAGIRHKAQRQGNVFHGVLQCTRHRGNVLEGFAHHANVGVRVRTGLRQNVGEVPGIGCLQPEGRQSIGHNVGSGRQVFTGGRSQAHNTVNAV